MIKILHIVSALNAGGVETLLYNFYKNMNQQEFHFDIGVTCGDSEMGAYAEKFKEVGSEVFKLPSKKNIFKYNSKLKKILKTNQYDIVHVHQDERCFQSLFCAKNCGVKVRIAHAHRCYEIAGFVNSLLKKLTNKYSTHKFACSEDASKFIFGTTENVYLMNNAIDIASFSFDEKLRKIVRAELQLKDDDIVLGAIARVAEEKNPIFAIDVIGELSKKLKNIKFFYIGKGNMMEEVKQYIVERGLQNNCFMLGEKLDAYKYYNAFDMFFLPSLNEGFGISALEAQTNGLFTIISDGFPNSVQVNNSGVEFIELNKSAGEWADKIYEIIKDNGVKRVNNDVKNSVYCIDKASKLLENKYKEIKKL